MRTLKLLTGSAAALFVLTIYSAATAEHMIPAVGIMQTSQGGNSPSSPILLALNDNMGDLEITMELMDESSDNSADIVNRIQLPFHLRERKMANEQHRKREKNVKRPEFIFSTGPEIREQAREVREDNEMIEDLHEQVKEQTREIRENNEMIEDVREQVKEQQSTAVEEIREQNKKSGGKGR